MDGTIFQTIRRIARFFWRSILLALTLHILQLFVGNYTYVAFQQLLDGLTATLQMTALSPLLAVFIGTHLLNHVLVYIEGIPYTRLNQGVMQWVKLRLLEKIGRVDYLAYQELGTGNLIQIAENGAEATRKILTEFYMGIITGIAQILVALYFIRTYDQTLFAVILAGYGLFYLFSYYLMKYLKQQVEKMLSNQEDFSSKVVRAFMELVVFRVNGQFKAEFERVQGISDEIVQTRTRVYLLQELSYTGFALLIFLVEAVVVVQQVNRIVAGESTIGTLVALTGFIQLVFSPIIGLGRAWMQYRLDALAFQRMDAVLRLRDDPGLLGGVEPVVTHGTVTFEQVDFAYPDQEVLADFSLTIEGGKTTAFVGASGSGKSTLVRLLLHLLKPQRGCVRVDGQDLSGVNLSAYYRQVAYVPQEPPVFDGTLEENLTFGRPVDEAHIREVIRKVGLEGLVQKLPRGLQTPVGERGIKLSGGERQRLAFGRVMLQNPKIVILDEPTSALDSLTEELVTRHMAAFLQDRTVIIVAHRLQTVRSADQIVVLDAGQVVQQGRFTELVSSEGKIRDLWERQSREQSVSE